jgi:hypothetical protein
MSGQPCEKCGVLNALDAPNCSVCGSPLPAGIRTVNTGNLDNDDISKPEVRWGTAYFGEQSVLRVRIDHIGEIIEARFDAECILGRAGGEVTPNVDLSPYDAQKMGVSRAHAKLTHENATIMLQDMDSVNGTFLNGEKLVPHQPRVLRNEDELRLGQMILRVSFLRVPPPKPAEPQNNTHSA